MAMNAGNIGVRPPRSPRGAEVVNPDDFQWRPPKEDNPYTDNKYWKWIPVKKYQQNADHQTTLWAQLLRDGSLGMKVVLKRALRGDDTRLREEAAFMETLTNTGAEHVVSLLKNMGTRIYMEYGEGGDLLIETNERILDSGLKVLVSERNVWRIWYCLVKNLSVMDSGTENLADRPPEEDVGKGGEDEWQHLIHLDIKPNNIFIGGRDQDEHTVTRIYKIGDWGIAIKRDPSQAQLDPETKQRYRNAGTRGWEVPEQFTDAWDYDTWENDPRCGNYTIKTCIWAVAQEIWQLMLLSYPFPRDSVYRSTQADPSGSSNLRWFDTFGEAIEETKYSDMLKATVLRCLIMNPEGRPGVTELMTLIESIMNGDPWDDLKDDDKLEDSEPDVELHPDYNGFYGRGGGNADDGGDIPLIQRFRPPPNPLRKPAPQPRPQPRIRKPVPPLGPLPRVRKPVPPLGPQPRIRLINNRPPEQPRPSGEPPRNRQPPPPAPAQQPQPQPQPAAAPVQQPGRRYPARVRRPPQPIIQPDPPRPPKRRRRN